MMNSAIVQNSVRLDQLHVLRMLQVLQQASPQLTQAFQTLIPPQNPSKSSTQKRRIPQRTLIEELPLERQAKLKRLVSAAFDEQKQSLKDVGALVQLLEATQQVLTEHWSDLSSEVRSHFAAIAQVMLDVVSAAPTGRFRIETIEMPPEHSPEKLTRLVRYLEMWTLLKHPRRTIESLKRLLVVLPQFARTVQRLRDRDLKVAQFQRKLAESKDWDREAQIQRNQAAIALIRSRIQKDEQMTDQEENQAIAEFEQFKQMIDENRPSGNKLYAIE